MKRAEKREHLVDQAMALFNREGFHATGVDLIIAKAGIAKTTLYRHFKTKEDLIAAALRKSDERYRADMRAFVEAAASAPRDRLLATFDDLEAWFREGSFHGCPFMSAASEYGDRTDAVFQEARLHKRLTLAYFEELARAAALEPPEEIAQYVNLLHEGAVAVAQISGEPSAARTAKRAAAALIS
jgi:AcrR family transcriptional regulator